MNKNLIKLCETAIMIALATALSLVNIITLPQGGSVTLCSMLPIVLIAYRYNTGWGILSGAIYGIIQMILGASNLSYGANIWAIIAIILFDYVLAYATIGFAGIFKDKIKHNQPLEIGIGTGIVCFLRFVCHFISGVAVWGAWADYYPWSAGMSAWLYSLIYNSTYMSVELLITVIGAVAIASFIDFRTDIVSPLKRNK